MNFPVVTTEVEDLLSTHVGRLTLIIEERMALAYWLISNISLEPSTFFDPFPSIQVKRWKSVAGKIKADLNSCYSPNHREGTGSDYLAWSSYFWIKASKGYSECPQLYKGLAAEMMFTDRKWQDPDTGVSLWRWVRRALKGGADFCKGISPLPVTFYFYAQVYYFLSTQLNHYSSGKPEGSFKQRKPEGWSLEVLW